MIDHEDLYWSLLWFQFQPKLPVNRFRQSESANGIHRCPNSGSCSSCVSTSLA